jgi:hypothetical protein
MKRSVCLALVTALFGLVAVAQAADKADPTGTWKFEVTRGDQKREQTLKLKLEGDKLTGALLGRNDQETKIEDATFKDNEVAFSVTREFNGNKVTTKYKGKLDGDTIKGKFTSDRNGKTNERDWEAKREKK